MNQGHQPTPKEAAKELITLPGTVQKSHIIMDAAFGSLELGIFFTEQGYLWTMSVNKQTQTKWLWEEMAKNICKGEGRVMMNKDGVVASLFSDNSNHTVYSNSWKKQAPADSQLLQNRPNDSNNSNESDDSDLETTAQEHRNEHQGAEWEVSKILDRKLRGNILVYNTLWSTEETTWEIFSSFIDEDRFSQAFLQFANERDWMVGFSGFKLEKLKKICTFLGISRSM